jgi:hypothetical protein
MYIHKFWARVFYYTYICRHIYTFLARTKRGKYKGDIAQVCFHVIHIHVLIYMHIHTYTYMSCLSWSVRSVHV